ncbi:MAG: gluconate 2-dehydrogenase subunit 3 family protein [Rhizomicrobium sp.]
MTGNKPKNSSTIDRRSLLLTGALAGTAGVAAAAARHDGGLGAPPQTIQGTMPWREGTADAPPASTGTDYRFFNAFEQAFVLPAIDRLIPPDATGPSATQANVHIFLDHQLAGPYGRGDHFYLGGPWPSGTPEQGYQSRLTPAQFYRASILAVEGYVRTQYRGKLFGQLAHADQDAVLKGLESGGIKLANADGKAFFAMFLQNVLEGYFSDPIYGGNKDMAAWAMIGFPGAHYDYREWVGRHGRRVPFPPTSLNGRPGWSEG